MDEKLYMESLLDIPEEIYMEEFTPMEQRLENTNIYDMFQELKKEMDPVEFERYFNSLINIKKHEKDMLMITYSENARAIIIREYFDLIKKIFNVSNIIIVAQSK